MPSLTAKILNTAADILSADDAWAQGYYAFTIKSNGIDKYNHQTEPEDPAAVCFCAAGAIRRAAVILEVGDPRDESAASETASDHVAAETNGLYDSIVDYNDAPNRTADEVIGMLRGAAATREVVA